MPDSNTRSYPAGKLNFSFGWRSMSDTDILMISKKSRSNANRPNKAASENQKWLLWTFARVEDGGWSFFLFYWFFVDLSESRRWRRGGRRRHWSTVGAAPRLAHGLAHCRLASHLGIKIISNIICQIMINSIIISKIMFNSNIICHIGASITCSGISD